MKCLSLGFTPSRSVHHSARSRIHGRPVYLTAQRRADRRRHTPCRATPDPDMIRKMQESLDAAMKSNPQMKQRMDQLEDAMKKNPSLRQEVQEAVTKMQNPETMQRLMEIRNDPELKDKFAEIQKGGMPAVMKAMGDTDFLQKVGQAVGPIAGMPAPPAAATAPPTAPPVLDPVPPTQSETPEINTILDAAKYGDIEAVEDFIAIGKDPNLVDEFQRSPLHAAVTIQHMEIIDVLLGAGADTELTDIKGNTPLHYAAGYGRVEAVERLLAAGANGAAKNENGKSPGDVARLSDKNPLLQNEVLIKRLDELAAS